MFLPVGVQVKIHVDKKEKTEYVACQTLVRASDVIIKAARLKKKNPRLYGIGKRLLPNGIK